MSVRTLTPVRWDRYGDERLMRLDALLIGVNCCMFNGFETPFYATGLEFLAGALKMWKCDKKPIAATGVSMSKDVAVYETPARGQDGSSIYFQEEIPAASSSMTRGARGGRQSAASARGRGGDEELEGGGEEDDEDGEEFVPTKLKGVAKSNKKRKRARGRGYDSGSDEESDASWGGGDKTSDDESRPAARKTRAQRMEARGSRAGRKGAAGGGGRARDKRRRLAVASESPESEEEESFEEEDSD